MTHDVSSEVLEPGKESLDLPPPLVASEWPTALRPLRSGPPMRRNQLYASPGQFGIQAVRLVGVVANETRRDRLDKPGGEGRTHRAT